jgi:hypothetical protein
MTPFSFAFNVACVGLGVTEQNHNNIYYQIYSIQNSDASIQEFLARLDQLSRRRRAYRYFRLFLSPLGNPI